MLMQMSIKKVLYVYEKIVDEVDYDESAPDNRIFTAYLSTGNPYVPDIQRQRNTYWNSLVCSVLM